MTSHLSPLRANEPVALTGRVEPSVTTTSMRYGLPFCSVEMSDRLGSCPATGIRRTGPERVWVACRLVES